MLKLICYLKDKKKKIGFNFIFEFHKDPNKKYQIYIFFLS